MHSTVWLSDEIEADIVHQAGMNHELCFQYQNDEFSGLGIVSRQRKLVPNLLRKESFCNCFDLLIILTELFHRANIRLTSEMPLLLWFRLEYAGRLYTL